MKAKLISSLLIISTIFGSSLTSCTDHDLEANKNNILDIVTPPEIKKTKVNETTYTLTATITPSEATIKLLDWSINFVNPSSEWAKGKNVEDYVSLSAVGTVATVKLIKRFSEQIEVKAKTTDGSDVEATCLVDCYKHVDSIEFTFDEARIADETNNIASFAPGTYGDGIELNAQALIDNQSTYELNLAQVLLTELTFTDGTLSAIDDDGLSLSFSAFPDYNVDGGNVLVTQKIIEFRDYSMIINPAVAEIENIMNYMVTDFGENLIPDVLVTATRAGVEKTFPIYVYNDISYVENVALEQSSIKFE